MATLEKRPSKEVDIERRAASPSDSEKSATGVIAERPPTWRWVAVCAGLYIGAFLYGLDTTISADVQASVYEQFKEIEKLAWVGMGFPMGSVAVILLVGSLFATFDIKWLLVGFFAAFEAGSALCGAAPNINALIVGRVLAGIGGSGMYIGCLTYFTVFTTLKERPIYNAVTGLFWGVGAILGPVIGGAFSVNSHTTWRWAFYINVPLAGAFAPAYIFLFPSYQPRPSVSVGSKFKHLDWVGAFLNATTFVLLVVALTFPGPQWSWSAPGTIVAWVFFGLSAAAFAVQQTFCIFTTPERRLFPVHLLKSRTMVSLYLATAASSGAMCVCLYYIPLFFQFTRGDSALQAAVRLLPFIFPQIISMVINGALLPVFKRYAPWYAFGGVLVLISGVLFYEMSPTTKAPAIDGFQVMTGFGAGLVFQVAYSVGASKLQGADIAASIGFFNVAQIGSMAIALSIAGAIFQNVGYSNLKAALAEFHLPEQILRDALAGSQGALAGANNPQIAQLAVGAIVKTISTAFSLQIAAGALLLVSAACMSWEKLNFAPA